jgi:phosphate transport system permease protein
MSKTILEEDDVTSKANIHTSDEARKRLQKRYGKERRFRLLGLGAVLSAALFLVILLATIIKDAVPVLFQHNLTITVPLTAEEIDPSGKRTAASVSGADYGGLTKAYLREQFPSVKGRREKKALYGLLSANAGQQIQQAVMDDPSLIGKPLTLGVLLSDYADLYFKGSISDRATIATQGIVSPVGTSGEIKLLSTSNDFEKIVVEVKEGLTTRLKNVQREIEGQQRVLKRLETNQAKLDKEIAAATASDQEELQKRAQQIERDREAAQNRIAASNKEISDLKQRIESAGNSLAVDRDISSYIIAVNGGMVKVKQVSNTEVIGEAILPLKSEAESQKGAWEIIKISPPESSRQISDKEIVWLDHLDEKGLVKSSFNTQFFTSGASREAEVAGIWGAVVGTFFTMLVTLFLSFPIGVGAAIYLEEFAPKNKITDMIEVNINNLAAVPSIVFGLLGLAMFLNIFGMPRSAPLVGGMVLALMTLPTIIIASRAALKAVPPSIKEAALGIGASHMQAVFHHNLPLAMPGILTGSIIGMAQALG